MNKSLVILVTSCLFLSGCLQSSNDLSLYGTEYKNPPDAPDFTLLNQDGESVTLSDYSDKVIVVAFIYTSCPDVCLAISGTPIQLTGKEKNQGFMKYKEVKILAGECKGKIAWAAHEVLAYK